MDIFTAFTIMLVVMTYYLHEFHWTVYSWKVTTFSLDGGAYIVTPRKKVTGFTGECKGRLK